MPRSSRRSAPARSAPAPAPRAAPAPTTQAARTSAAQQQHSNVPATVPQGAGPGIMGSIAANAASIAVGHTMARGIGNALGWNGGHQEAPAAADPQTVQPPMEQQQSSYGGYGQTQQQQSTNSCANYAKDFTNCLSATNNDMQSCSYYLDQLKACQAAAAPY